MGGWGGALLGLGVGAALPSLLAKTPDLPPPPSMSEPIEMPSIDQPDTKKAAATAQRRRRGRRSTILTTPDDQLLGA